MKIQIDIDGEVWSKFREMVQGQGKTLREVVPGVIEPVLRGYVDPPQTIPELPASPVPAESPLKRCPVCDKMVDRLFHIPNGRGCYECWKHSQ